MSAYEQFGKYILLRKIATGGMAEIFLAKQAGLGDIDRFVVIKRVLPHLTENPEFSRMFVDEMRLAAVLNHPNIVQIIDIGAVGEQYFIAMEYLEGRDLRCVMRKAAGRGEIVPLSFSIRAVCDMCEGLNYAHHRRGNQGQPLNIIHRDVSPQNVMSTVQGAVKLLDFGIAKAESQLNETRSGVLKGKYSYMSPEQAMGQPLDPRSDLFAIGIILYELTTGRRLFKHPNEVVVLKMVADADVPPPSVVDPGYPPELEQIVMKALAKNPDERYSNCRELQNELQEFAAPRRLMMGPAEVGDYISLLFQDERYELDPASLPPTRPDDEVISFIDARESSASGAASFPSLLERAVAAEEESKTSSLSMFVQRARRRPLLTFGASIGVASLALLMVLYLTLGDGAADVESTPQPNPLITSNLGPDASATLDDTLVRFGTIAVESTPPGARIFIDGEEQEETAPTNIPAVTVGDEHFIVAEMEGHTAQARRITLRQDGDFQTARFDFEGPAATPARLELEGLPDGATVSIDGQNRSGDNLTLEPSVPHTVEVTHEGQELLSEEVNADPGEVVELRVRRPRRTVASGGHRTSSTATPRGSGTLMVSSSPTTTVYLGSQALGQTPVNRDVPPGVHKLRLVNRSLLINHVERVRIRPGERVQRSVTIPRGTLRVSARPYAEVSINGARQGRTPLRKSLYAGRYIVVLRNSDLDRTERRVVRISGGGDERIRVDWR